MQSRETERPGRKHGRERDLLSPLWKTASVLELKHPRITIASQCGFRGFHARHKFHDPPSLPPRKGLDDEFLLCVTAPIFIFVSAVTGYRLTTVCFSPCPKPTLNEMYDLERIRGLWLLYIALRFGISPRPLP